MAFDLRIASYLAAVALTGCMATSSEKGTGDAAKLPASASEVDDDDERDDIEAAEVAGEEAEGITAEEPELAVEDFEQGFCADDIYAKYLKSRFTAERGSTQVKREPVSRRSRGRSRLNTFDVAALSYARDRMNGRASPYFGALPIVVNDRVDFWVQYYKTSGRRQFMSWLVRGESVKKMVQPILQESGVPMEFFYLAMIESGFSNSAYSTAKATGTWQFMRGTAQLYGLKINHWVDERRDPVKSTIAAANYLRDLYADLGDWHLAMAAYNAGPGKVRKAIRRSGTRDYWQIAETKHLAKETKHYVPKVLAAVLLATENKTHGFEVQSNPVDALPETEVIVKRPVKLEELAQKLKVSVKTLTTWNPELIRDITPPVKSGYALRLPTTYANVFPSIENQLSYIEVTDIHMHTIRRGDTLARIARQYKVAIKQILAVNPGVKASRLRPGHQVAIPIPGVVSMGKPPKGEVM